MIDREKITKVVTKIAAIFDDEDVTALEVLSVCCSFAATILSGTEDCSLLKKQFKDALDKAIDQIDGVKS